MAKKSFEEVNKIDFGIIEKLIQSEIDKAYNQAIDDVRSRYKDHDFIDFDFASDVEKLKRN